MQKAGEGQELAGGVGPDVGAQWGKQGGHRERTGETEAEMRPEAQQEEGSGGQGPGLSTGPAGPAPQDEADLTPSPTGTHPSGGCGVKGIPRGQAASGVCSQGLQREGGAKWRMGEGSMAGVLAARSTRAWTTHMVQEPLSRTCVQAGDGDGTQPGAQGPSAGGNTQPRAPRVVVTASLPGVRGGTNRKIISF